MDQDNNCDSVKNRVALSPQQVRFTESPRSKAELYRELTVGDAAWSCFLLNEFYQLCFASLGGALGYAIRALLLSLLLKSLGRGVTVGRGVTIRQPRRISLGNKVILDDFSVLDVRAEGESGSILLEDHVLLGRNSLIIAKGGSVTLKKGCNISSFCRIATQSKVTVGESVLLAAYAYIGPGNHTADDPAKAMIEQPMEQKGGVSIGDFAWIGAHSIVLDGVSIGAHAIVGSNSLVREDVPPGAIVAGSPARIIKYRPGFGGS